MLTLHLSSGDIQLTEEDLLIEMTRSERYFSVEENGITVALDTQLTDALIEEGFVRELVSKLQTMRKEAGFNVEDHILVSAANNDKLIALMQANQDVIAADTLADGMTFGTLDGYTKEWDVNGETISLAVKKVNG